MTIPNPSRSMKTTRKTMARADFPERLGGSDVGMAGEIGCVWMGESGIIDGPVDWIFLGRVDKVWVILVKHGPSIPPRRVYHATSPCDLGRRLGTDQRS